MRWRRKDLEICENICGEAQNDYIYNYYDFMIILQTIIKLMLE